jgi:hypothetical protein
MSALRKAVLGLALLATVALSFVDGPLLPQPSEDLPVRKPSDGRPPARPAAAGPGAAVPAMAATARNTREAYGPADADLFAARNWQPVAPAPVRLAEAAPVAPPLPFRYLGKMLSDGQVMAIVAQDSRTLLLRQGDRVANYQVVDITPEHMTLMYIPLNQTQQLPFGSAH